MSDTDNDLDVLHPERTITLGGEQVTVREYGNLEWLRLLAGNASAVVDAVERALEVQDTTAIYENVFNTVCLFADEMLPLVLQSVDRDLAWVERLSKDDLEELVMCWWSVNGPFFVQRAANQIAVRMHARQIAAALAGAESTPA